MVVWFCCLQVLVFFVDCWLLLHVILNPLIFAFDVVVSSDVVGINRSFVMIVCSSLTLYDVKMSNMSVLGVKYPKTNKTNM